MGKEKQLTPDEQQFMEHLGVAIFFYRKKARYTQKQLAEQAGITVASVGRIERGHTAPSVVVLYRLTKAMGIELQKLFIFMEMRWNWLKSTSERE